MSDRKTIKFSDLPEVGELPEGMAKRAQDLLDEAVAVKQLLAGYEEALEEVMAKLEALQQELTLPGVRAKIGDTEWGFASQEVAGRRSLDKVLLMEKAGVSKKVLDACMKTGKESTRRTLRKVGEKEDYGNDE